MIPGLGVCGGVFFAFKMALRQVDLVWGARSTIETIGPDVQVYVCLFRLEFDGVSGRSGDENRETLRELVVVGGIEREKER